MNRWCATVAPSWDLQAWREAARAGVRAGIAPHDLDWEAGTQAGLLGLPAVTDAPALLPPPQVKANLLQLADSVLCHREPGGHALLYRLLWRMTHGEPLLLENPADPDSHRAHALAQAVRRDSHKMKAFVRFRQLAGQQDHFVAWFEPEHFIVDRVAPFFARRFAGMHWAILTPYRSAAWDRETLVFGPGANRADAPSDDAGEDLWRTYYANIFNPARINPRMMRQEMPQRYWKHLPEAKLIPGLLRDAGTRVAEMDARPAQAPKRRIPAPVPLASSTPLPAMPALRAQARKCRACPLWEPATQTVFGEGPANARIMLVGEQPGDAEDLSGRPFVGPAGKLLNQALAEAGIPRESIYLTNAVKHFRFEQRGKRRLHRNPDASHVSACSSWLAQEAAIVQPRAIVCLGATAARAVFGAGFAVMRERGTWRTRDDGTRGFASVHPSWILRQTGEAREAGYRQLVADLCMLHEIDAGP
ncbi:MAG: UdgX family uracil-DNA binding protein [Pseudomonadota bacterium]|nr:UdgX family uracil-DNA binding protein [Pseudomonadota bacterium]